MARLTRVAAVHCDGGAGLLPGISREELPKDCAAIKEAHPEGISACQYGCLGGGSCVAACPFGAIALTERGVARVDDQTCKGCGRCAKACPQQLIELVPAQNVMRVRCSNQDTGPVARKLCEHSCIGCGLCERACPTEACKVVEGHAVINQNLCIACGMCAVTCPRGVIHDANGIYTAE